MPEIKTKAEEYAEYLRTQHWRELRALAYEVHGDRCHCCNARPVEMHHLRYGDWYDVLPNDLIPLCESCHEKAHRKSRAKALLRSDRPSGEKHDRLIAILRGLDPDQKYHPVKLSKAVKMSPAERLAHGIKIVYEKKPSRKDVVQVAPYLYTRKRWVGYRPKQDAPPVMHNSPNWFTGAVRVTNPDGTVLRAA